MPMTVTYELRPDGTVRVRWGYPGGLRYYVDFDDDPYRHLTAMESAREWVSRVLNVKE